MQYFRIIVLFIAILLVLVGCKGPAGPTGPAGNANVHAKLFTVSSWSFSSPQYYATLTDADVTQDIVDNGMVAVYYQTSGGYYEALAYTTYPSSSYASTWVFSYTLNTVMIFKYDSDLTQPGNPGTRTFKVVAIAGVSANINLNNYEEVKAYYHLQD